MVSAPHSRITIDQKQCHGWPCVRGMRIRVVDVLEMLAEGLGNRQLAAALGLPYAFASHFAPGLLDQALEIYRARFRPSERWSKPHVMLGLNICAAETDQEARRLFSSLQQSFLNLRRGQPGRLPPPVNDMDSRIDPMGRAMLTDSLACACVGAASSVKQQLDAFLVRTQADEIMITANIFDHQARKRSFEIVAGIGRDIGAVKPAAAAGIASEAHQNPAARA